MHAVVKFVPSRRSGTTRQTVRFAKKEIQTETVVELIGSNNEHMEGTIRNYSARSSH